MAEICSFCGDPMEGHGHWDACKSPERTLERIKRFVSAQAGDDGLWFVPETVTEDYLQRALRSLHEVIEGKTAAECAIAALHS